MVILQASVTLLSLQSQDLERSNEHSINAIEIYWIAIDMWYSKTPTKLKYSSKIPWDGGSDTLIRTSMDVGSDPREAYLSHPELVQPPVISASEFVPKPLISHLMRNKKDSALGVKYIPGDETTNMEGALHTFITPIVPILMFGDYVFTSNHGVQRFEPTYGKQVARQVLLSASIHMDFEMGKVMFAVCKFGSERFQGKSLPFDFRLPSKSAKEIPERRLEYEATMRSHMVAHLTADGYLPSKSEVSKTAMDREAALQFLEEFILSPTSTQADMIRKSVRINQARDTVSLELLFNTAVHQLRNEFSALELTTPQGYVYTYDPASIFAREIGAGFLNRVMFAALKHLSSENRFANMIVYAFNDYADRGALKLAEAALRAQKHVRVLPKRRLFKGWKDTYDPSGIEGGKGAFLVIHNNSDAFGQNIETEGESGSLEGAVGANSSAAASLLRTREDLLDNVL
jgi:hypothetical protein